jgi:uncharacterized secreted protein with C-terminal beta-propeller domain
MKGFAYIAVFGLIVLASAGIVAFQALYHGPGGTQVQDGLNRFTSCEQINSFLEENQGSAYYGGFETMAMNIGAGVMRDVTVPLAAPEAAGGQKSAEGSEDYSTTNIQVEGVDEPDIVKNDGKYIYTVSGSTVYIIDAYPAEGMKILSEIASEGVTQIFVNGDRLVVFGSEYWGTYYHIVAEAIATYYPGASPITYVHVYDISDRENPVLKRNVSFEGSYFDSRMVGDYIYIIADKSVYYGDGPVPLPMVYSESGSRPACGCTDLYYFDMPDYSYRFMTIASLDVKDASAELQTKVIMSGYTDTMYVSSDNIYISYMKRISYWDQSERLVEAIKTVLPSDISSQISAVQASDSSKQDKLQSIGEITTTPCQRMRRLP